eukprot:16029125-Heterocapsa_arctica.AAC.1
MLRQEQGRLRGDGGPGRGHSTDEGPARQHPAAYQGARGPRPHVLDLPPGVRRANAQGRRGSRGRGGRPGRGCRRRESLGPVRPDPRLHADDRQVVGQGRQGMARGACG